LVKLKPKQTSKSGRADADENQEREKHVQKKARTHRLTAPEKTDNDEF